MDRSSDIYIADTYNSRIRKMILNSPTSLSASGGDGQTGDAGSTLPKPLTVGITFRAGVNLAGIPVAFAVTSGAAALSAPTASTDANGVAGVGVTLGATPGVVVVTATLSGLPPVQFHLTATAASVPSSRYPPFPPAAWWVQAAAFRPSPGSLRADLPAFTDPTSRLRALRERCRPATS